MVAVKWRFMPALLVFLVGPGVCYTDKISKCGGSISRHGSASNVLRRVRFAPACVCYSMNV